MSYDAFDSLPSGVIVIDVKTDKTLYINKALLDLLGIFDYQKDICWFTFVSLDEETEIRNNVTNQLQQNKTFSIELCLNLYKLKTIWIVASGKKHIDALIVTITDITKIKETQLKYYYMTQEMTKFTDTVPDGILNVKKDNKLTILHANNAFYNILGYTEEEFANLFNNQISRLINTIDFNAIAQDLKKQLKDNNSFNLQFRINTKNNGLIWVRFTGVSMDKTGYLNCIMTDIDENKKTIDNLKKEQEHNRTILELSNDIIFEYDILEATLTLSSNVALDYNVPLVFKNCPDSILERNFIHEKDIELVLGLLDAFKLGDSTYKIDFRVKLESENIKWFTIDYKLIFDDDNKPIKSVGKIKDITEQKEIIIELEAKTKTDPLTKIYNKEATGELIKKSLKQNPNGRAAFFLIDIDNFKGVNDNLGHQFGDSVLKNIAESIKHEFRENDIVGRIGGDEFVVFIKNIPSNEIIIQKANALINVFRRTYSGQNNNYKISGSIGITIYPNGGTTFEELYKNADIALYESKKCGKDCFKFYSQLTAKDVMTASILTFDDRQVANYYKDDLTYNIFEMLYETKDLHTTINMVLEIIGKQYNVDRCYIFEKTGDYFNNTFEWCKDNISSGKNMLQNVPFSSLKLLFSKYSTEGIFFSDKLSSYEDKTLYNIFSKQNVKSFLHCAIFDNRAIKGFIGFDDCSKTRVWTIKEISTLSYIAKILSIFLIKMNMYKELASSYRNMTTMLDNMKAYIYVIEENTYNTLYLNKETISITKNAKLGNKCYNIAFDKNQPCEQCPKYYLDEQTTNYSLEIYNPVYDVWTLTTASKITWAGKPAVLIFCMDITKYKKGECLYEDSFDKC